MSIKLSERRELVKEGIDMLMDLFNAVEWQKEFPRKMSTDASDDKQFAVYSRDEILRKCVAARFEDCRLNGYPTMGKPDIDKGYMAPTILFIDLDEGDRTEAELSDILEKTLAKIKEVLGISPLVLWTGNGYHVYIGIKMRPLYTKLELMERCRQLGTQPNREFLRFAGPYFSDGKSDPARDNNISQLTALLRIPYTLNVKCLENGRDPVVKVVQKHSSEPALINDELMLDFNLYIANKWVNRGGEAILNENCIFNTENDDWNEDDDDDEDDEYHGKIRWIENVLLKTPMSKNRWQYLFHIIGPYLRHTRRLPKAEAKRIMVQWLQLCDQKSQVPKPQSKLASALSGSPHWAPWKLETLKRKNNESGFEYQELVDAIDRYYSANEGEEYFDDEEEWGEDDDKDWEENED
jgi:hypothetical protein